MTALPTPPAATDGHLALPAPRPALRLLDGATSGLLSADGELAWSQVEALAHAAVLHWRQQGLVAGDRVLHAVGNTAADAVALLALLHADASVVLLDPRETLDEAARVAAVSRCRWIVTGAPFAPGDLGADVRSLGAVDAGLRVADLPPGTATARLDLTAWRRREDALVTWSSGSTGRPKGVVRSGAAVLDNLEATSARLGYQPHDVLLPLLSISHQYGLSLLLLAWRAGAGLVLGRPDRLDRLLRLGTAAGATVVDATPSTYHALLALEDRRPGTVALLERVRMWCTGGACLTAELAERFAELTGQPLLDGYGSTEAGNIALADLGDPVACGTPLRGVDVRVVDDAARQVGVGAPGCLQVRSPYLYGALLDESGELRPREGTWFDTGDLGSVDDAGRVTVLGRRDAVHCLGHVVYPDALAQRISAATGAQVAVVALEDPRRGSALVLVVGEGPCAAAVPELARTLPPHERPVRTVSVPTLPLGRTGKLDRERLRALARTAVADGPARAGLPRRPARSPVLPGQPPGGALAQRAEALRAVHDEVARHRGRYVRVLTEIGTHHAAELEVDAFLHTLAGACDEVDRWRPAPIARLAVFLPSNILLYSMALHLLVPSLYAQRVVCRPSSQVSAQTLQLHELLAPVHGLPVEVVECSQREFVDEHVQRADACVFTGTYDNAEQVRARLRPDQLFAFFGQGVNPFVVTPGADLDRAVADVMTMRLLNSGQDCLAPDVVFVHTSVAQQFVDRLTLALDGVRCGDGADPTAGYGPLFYESSLEAAAQYLLRHRDRIVSGGTVDFATRVVEPTVVRAGFDERLVPTEVFAPVFTVVDYADAAALSARLTSPFFSERALGATVHGEAPDLVAALRRRHTVSVDTTLLALEDGNRPFGGAGVRANYVAHRGQRTAKPLLLSQLVAEHLGRSA